MTKRTVSFARKRESIAKPSRYLLAAAQMDARLRGHDEEDCVIPAKAGIYCQTIQILACSGADGCPPARA
ncbi:MAG TPA: hypothetical protein VGK87_07725 [Anaerolineae bacterium]